MAGKLIWMPRFVCKWMAMRLVQVIVLDLSILLSMTIHFGQWTKLVVSTCSIANWCYCAELNFTVLEHD